MEMVTAPTQVSWGVSVTVQREPLPTVPGETPPGGGENQAQSRIAQVQTLLLTSSALFRNSYCS